MARPVDNLLSRHHSGNFLRNLRQPKAVPATPGLGDRVASAIASVSITKEMSHGPGTELKKLLALVGITATPNCSCNARAAEMDRQGCDWCQSNIDTIVGWLREEAEKRGLPFVDIVGRLLVRRAIANARRAASTASTPTPNQTGNPPPTATRLA